MIFAPLRSNRRSAASRALSLESATASARILTWNPLASAALAVAVTQAFAKSPVRVNSRTPRACRNNSNSRLQNALLRHLLKYLAPAIGTRASHCAPGEPAIAAWRRKRFATKLERGNSLPTATITSPCGCAVAIAGFAATITWSTWARATGMRPSGSRNSRCNSIHRRALATARSLRPKPKRGAYRVPRLLRFLFCWLGDGDGLAGIADFESRETPHGNVLAQLANFGSDQLRNRNRLV